MNLRVLFFTILFFKRGVDFTIVRILILIYSININTNRQTQRKEIGKTSTDIILDNSQTNTSHPIKSVNKRQGISSVW